MWRTIRVSSDSFWFLHNSAHRFGLGFMRVARATLVRIYTLPLDARREAYLLIKLRLVNRCQINST